MPKIKLVVENGQYERAATLVTINCTTDRGLQRRVRQLQNKYAIYGDNWAGWILATVAIAHNNDIYTPNQIIDGASCEPVNGWLDDNDIDYLSIDNCLNNQ